jgi:protein arginine kinase
MKFVEFPKSVTRRKNKLDNLVFSSRVRFTRNLEGLKFPAFLSDKDKFDIDENLSDNIAKLPFEIVIENIEDIPRERIMIYAGTDIISREFVKSGRKLAYEVNGDWVILLNEDDHFRIFSIETGYNIKNIACRLIEVVRLIEKDIDFAFDEKWGYLTGSVLNMGTGMRMSVLVNLYGLVATKRIEEFITNSGEMGYAVNNLVGESSDSGLFFVYNIYSMGLSEEQMVDEFDAFLNRLYEMEMKARKEFFSDPDECEISYEEIVELINKDEIEWSALLYYISLIDAMEGVLLNLKNRRELRNLVLTAKDDYLIYKKMVDKDKISQARMEIIRSIVVQMKYKTSR